MTGLLRIDESGIRELAYSHPKNTRIVWGFDKIRGVVSSFDFEDRGKLHENIIYYHSHPIGGGILSVDDACELNRFIIWATDRRPANAPPWQSFFFNVYVPQTDMVV